MFKRLSLIANDRTTPPPRAFTAALAVALSCIYNIVYEIWDSVDLC